MLQEALLVSREIVALGLNTHPTQHACVAEFSELRAQSGLLRLGRTFFQPLPARSRTLSEGDCTRAAVRYQRMQTIASKRFLWGESLNREPVLVGRSLTKVYSTGEVEVRALDSVDIELFDGETVVFLGASGSGKSTLLNNLGGLDVPTSGFLTYRNRDLMTARGIDHFSAPQHAWTLGDCTGDRRAPRLAARLFTSRRGAPR
jgi:ABC-type glutathione transport system ATPase component